MTYLYSCEKDGEFEAEHSIKDELKECPTCKGKVKRLINSKNSFILNGSGWAKDSYSSK